MTTHHRLIASAALVLAHATALACADLTVGAHLGTHHFSKQEGVRYHDANPGAYLACDGWAAGIYRNSAARVSTWAGHNFSAGPASLTLGVATGYPHKRLSPIGLVSLALPGGLRLGAFPKVGEHSGGAHLMWEVRI